ncbi:ABC transporter substrate-binding protein [Cellulomonas sp. ATA003]|uniref:ABC transporter substrate-binding protein n=1 Tax=Cellulomonas sp. ATA003 TaxID=3073064 RepID=UPI0028731885|nr:ABC transporter substrate-binding protein [Cellulomonas sp. ATA003]WNB86494.1 ABC transporter substrate-binding protein [Cellulomonas sp. ATA003]
MIAEPVHGTGYLPLYVGIQEGFFADEGLDVSTVTLQGGGAHTNAVLTGEAWAFIGGPEHNAFAAARGEGAVVVKAIANVVNRGNNYLVAAPGLEYDGDLAAFLDGKTIVTGAYGGTPNSVTRYLLQESGLDVSDVQIIESADAAAALAIVQQGQAEVAMVSEPILGRGVAEGIWEEPFLDVPEELGPYAYSTINVRQDSIDSDPETVQAFTRALVKSLEFTRDEPERAMEIAQAEFPTLEPDVLAATLERSYEDEIWEWSGAVSEEAVETALDVVRASEVLKDSGDPVQYDAIVDMTFVDAVGSAGE